VTVPFLQAEVVTINVIREFELLPGAVVEARSVNFFEIDIFGTDDLNEFSKLFTYLVQSNSTTILPIRLTGWNCGLDVLLRVTIVF